MKSEPMWRRYRRFRGPDPVADIDEEFEFHLATRASELEARGVPPAEARRRALAEFGDIGRAKRECRGIDEGRLRQRRRADLLDALRQDVRVGIRLQMRAPGFTLVAILTLALGIGANSAIFSVVNAVLLRPLPYEQSDRLVRVFQVWEGSRAPVSPANFFDVRKQNRTLEELSFVSAGSGTLTGVGDPVRLQVASVGARFFEVLRARPALGRAFRPEENEPGRNRVVVLSHALWQQRFGGDPGIVGRTLTLDGDPYEVVGVMPAGFSYPSDRALWKPYEYDAWFGSDASRGAWFIEPIGRLKPGVTPEQAARDVEAIGKRLEQAYPGANARVGVAAVPLYEVVVGDVRTAMVVLLGAVGLVLLIACVNVANLLLTRASTREGEFAVRVALGAGRSRLVRQLLTEGLLLAVLGGVLGLLLAFAGTSLLSALEPHGIPRLGEVGIDGRVVGFTALVALATGLMFGLIPARQATRPGLTRALKEGARGGLTGRASTRARSALVVSELALAVTLLSGAGLLVKSFVRLTEVDPGFRSEGALSFRLDLPETAYRDDAARAAFFEDLLHRLRALPGVSSAGGVLALPMSGPGFSFSFHVAGRALNRPGEEPSAQTRSATPDYFRTIGIPLLRGRAFTDQDRPGSRPVVVISSELARRYFPGEDPIGKRLTLGWPRDSVPVGGEIVGVVGDVREFGLDRDVAPTIYVPYAQVAVDGMHVVLRTSVPPTSLARAARATVAALDRDLPVTDLRPVEELVAESVSQPRFYTLLLGIFGVVALTLAAIGTFGVITYTVARRTHEIGVRIALGAAPSSVLRLVVGSALSLALAGVALGVIGGLVGSRLLSGLLFGVRATDPTVYAGVAAVLFGVTVLASYLPARRASRVDPVASLRGEA